MTGYPTDGEFLRTLGGALLALATSALLLVLLIIAYAHMQVPQGANTTHSKAIALDTFTTRMGATGIKGDSLEVTALDNLNNNQHALVTLKTSLRAENYPVLAYHIKGWHAGMRVNFIWRSATNPRGLSTAILNRNLGGAAYFNLAGQDNWQGAITEVGLHLQGELRDKPLVIDSLTLEPHGWRNTLSTIWSEWTAFRGWTGKSINFLNGTPGPPGSAILSPTLAMALWAGLSLALLFGFGVFRRSHQLLSYGLAIILPWIALDLLWQNELDTQLHETRYLFGGKSMHERHLADRDSQIYTYTKRLKEQVLPSAPARLFILHDSEGHNYDRLKVQYYLLPHNIYNFGRVPPIPGVTSGDYILVLGDIADLEFQERSGRLIWGEGNWLGVRRADQDSIGNLYKVMPATTKGFDPEEAALEVKRSG